MTFTFISAELKATSFRVNLTSYCDLFIYLFCILVKVSQQLFKIPIKQRESDSARCTVRDSLSVLYPMQFVDRSSLDYNLYILFLFIPRLSRTCFHPKAKHFSIAIVV